MSLNDVNNATTLIYEAAGESANIIFGAVIDQSMEDKMRVTVIATGFNSPAEDKMPVATPVQSVVPENLDAKTEQVVMPFSTEKGTPAPMDIFGTPVSPAKGAQQKSVGSGKTGNVYGNGNGSGKRNKVPFFSGEDRTIPAYIRRMDDTN